MNLTTALKINPEEKTRDLRHISIGDNLDFSGKVDVVAFWSEYRGLYEIVTLTMNEKNKLMSMEYCASKEMMESGVLNVVKSRDVTNPSNLEFYRSHLISQQTAEVVA